MADYILYNRELGKWVDEIMFDMDYNTFEITGVDGVFFTPFEAEAMILSDSTGEDGHGEEKRFFEELNLVQIYTSDEAYQYYSKDLDGWVTWMTEASIFQIHANSEATRPEHYKPYQIYPVFHVRKTGKSDALIVREEERIKWLKENTNLERVRVGENVPNEEGRN